jgi:CBS domain-containing protein
MVKVKEVMTGRVECIGPQDTCDVCARKMRDLDIGCLPVCDNDRIVGIVTDRDIVCRCLAEGKNPLEHPVFQIMTKGCIWCYDDQDLGHAEALMEEHQIRRIAVMSRDKRLVGILSLGDLAVRTNDEHMELAPSGVESRPALSRGTASRRELVADGWESGVWRSKEVQGRRRGRGLAARLPTPCGAGPAPVAPGRGSQRRAGGPGGRVVPV